MKGNESMSEAPPAKKLFMLKVSIRQQILACFLDGLPHEVNDIAASVGVSRQTVMKSLSFFMRHKLIETTGKGTASQQGGKRPLLYSLSSDLVLLCVTLWHSNFRINLYTLTGHLIDRVALETPLPDTPQVTAQNIAELSSMLLQKAGITPDRVYGLSVSVAGPVERSSNKIVFCVHAPQWGNNIPMADYLKPYFSDHTLILLESASKIHSGLYYLDDRFQSKRLLVISISRYGISGCQIEKGHMLNGTHSIIGEIGHIPVAPTDPEACRCGSRGCLEAIISIPRLLRLIQEEKTDFQDSPLLRIGDQLDYNDIFRASEKGDPLAVRCAEYLAFHLAAALRSAIVLYDPDVVVFAGKTFVGGEDFSRRIQRHLQPFRYYPGSQAPLEILYDEEDLLDRDAFGSMLTLRWYVFRHVELVEEPPAADSSCSDEA